MQGYNVNIEKVIHDHTYCKHVHNNGGERTSRTKQESINNDVQDPGKAVYITELITSICMLFRFQPNIKLVVSN